MIWSNTECNRRGHNCSSKSPCYMEHDQSILCGHHVKLHIWNVKLKRLKKLFTIISSNKCCTTKCYFTLWYLGIQCHIFSQTYQYSTCLNMKLSYTSKFYVYRWRLIFCMLWQTYGDKKMNIRNIIKMMGSISFFHVLVLNKSWDKFLSKTTKTICAMTDYEKLINKKESVLIITPTM